ncbi:MAG: CpaF family protein [Planctomycetota bacterium]
MIRTTTPTTNQRNGQRSKVLPDHVDPLEREFQQIKSVIHQQLIESLDLSNVTEDDQGRLYQQIRQLAGKVCKNRRELLGRVDRERLLDELMAEIYGVGPLQQWMDDPDVTDILVNDPYTVYVERNGRLELTGTIFADEEHLLRIIRRIVAQLGRRIDEASPMVDARLPDGSRVNAVIPPMALDGPALSIRRFGRRPLQLDDLLAKRSITPEMASFLQAAVEARIGLLVSGGTGAGKTTLLNALSSAIPESERLITIEDSAELLLQHRHLVRMETRPANTEGVGELAQRDLVRNSLRMRPDRIIVGEVRGPEVWDMLQAMNTGHEGSLTTIHANSARDALSRLEMMVAMTGYEMPVAVVRQYVASGMRLVVQAARLKGGSRKIVGVSEIRGVVGGEYQLDEIFGFEQTGVDAEGNAIGRFYATGYRPECLSRITAAGLSLPAETFEQPANEAH